MVTLFLAAGCGSSSAPHIDGPSALYKHRLYVDADGRTVHSILNCGGTLRAEESANQVVVGYFPPSLPPGAASCAIISVKVTLNRPLRGRTVIDAVDHSKLDVFDLSAIDRPDPGLANPLGDPAWSVGIACPSSGESVSEAPCGAQDYSIPGQPGRVTLVQDLAVGEDPFGNNPVPTPEAPPWCLKTYMPDPSAYCGHATCHPAGAGGIEACDAPDTRFPHYLTWQPDTYRLYLATSQPIETGALVQVAASVGPAKATGPAA